MSYNSSHSCRHCGAPLRPGARFCPKCGNPVAATPPPAPVPPAPSRASASSRLPWALVGTALVVLVGILIVGVWFVLQSKTESKDSPITQVVVTPSERDVTPATKVPTATRKPATSAPARASGPTETSEVADYLKCDPKKLPFPLPADVKDCQNLDPITNFRTNMAPTEVVQFYKDYMEKNGWQRKDDGALPGLGTWVSGSKRLAVITVVEKGMTSVQIQYTTK